MRRAIALAMAGACLLIAGCENLGLEPEEEEPFGLTQSDTGRPTETYQDAMRYLEDGRLNEAEIALGRLITDNPEDMQALLGLGEVHLRRGRTSQALEAFTSVPIDGDLGAEALQGKGLALVALKRDGEARDALLAAVEKDPSLWRSWNTLGELFDMDRNWVGSGNAYEKALAAVNTRGLAREKAIVLNNMGISLMMQQRYPEAQGSLIQSMMLDPTNKQAATNLRLTLAWQGRYAEATANAPTREIGDIYNNVGYIAMLNADYDMARQLFLKAIELSPIYHEKAARNLDALDLLIATQAKPN